MQGYWHYKFRKVDTGPNQHNVTHFGPQSIFGSQVDINSTTTNSLISNVEEHKLTPLQLKWNSYLSITYMIPHLGMLLLNATLGHKMPMRPRILSSLIGMIVIFILTDIMTQVNTDHYQNGFLSLTLVTVVLIASCVGILKVRQ